MKAKIKALFLTLVIISSQNSFAKSIEWLDISLMGFVSSQSIFRGAEYFPHGYGAAGPGFTFFDQFHLRGPNLAWTKGGRKDKHQFELGGRLLSDGEPMIEFSDSFNENTDFRSSRKDAFEFYGKYNHSFGFKNLFRVGIMLAKEVHRHKGIYSAINFKVPVYKFTSLVFTTGLGSKFNNQYLYGDSASSGLAHQNISLSYSLTTLPFNGVAIFQGDYDFIYQSENQSAERILNKDKNLTLSTRWIWNVY